MTAVANNNIDFVKILISKNADTTVIAFEGSNLVRLAAHNRHTDMCDFLLKNTDNDPYLKNNIGICAVD